MAPRAALGATRGRLARQFIAESPLLALLAGGLGVLLSFWGVKALVGLNQGYLPRADEISVDTRVLALSLALSLLVAVALGLVPLLRLGGCDLQESLKEAARGQSANATSHSLRAMLVVTQVALTMVLLLGAGLDLNASDRLGVRIIQADYVLDRFTDSRFTPATITSRGWRFSFGVVFRFGKM